MGMKFDAEIEYILHDEIAISQKYVVFGILQTKKSLITTHIQEIRSGK